MFELNFIFSIFMVESLSLFVYNNGFFFDLFLLIWRDLFEFVVEMGSWKSWWEFMERMLEDFVKVVGIFKDVFIGVEKGGSL